MLVTKIYIFSLVLLTIAEHHFLENMPGMVSFQTERLDQFNDIFGLKTDDEFQGRYWPMTYLPCSGTKMYHSL